MSAGLRADFDRNGYVVVRSLFDLDRMAHLEPDFDAITAEVLTHLFAGNDQEEGEVVHPNENLVLRGRRSGMTRGRAGS